MYVVYCNFLLLTSTEKLFRPLSFLVWRRNWLSARHHLDKLLNLLYAILSLISTLESFDWIDVSLQFQTYEGETVVNNVGEFLATISIDGR